MNRGTITIEDVDGGQFTATCCYEGGFNVESHAHQHTLLLMKHLNRIAEAKTDEVVYGDAPSARVQNPMVAASLAAGKDATGLCTVRECAEYVQQNGAETTEMSYEHEGLKWRVELRVVSIEAANEGHAEVQG